MLIIIFIVVNISSNIVRQYIKRSFGKNEDAIMDYSKALQNNTQNAKAYYFRGKIISNNSQGAYNMNWKEKKMPI